MAEYNGNEILFNPQLKVGGTDDYNELSNKPVINADLDNTAASTADQTVLYHHVGESTATYKKAALYYTDGTNWLQFKGEKGADGAQTVVYNGNDIIEVSSVAKGATFSLATSLLTGANTIKVGDSCILPLATSTEDEGLKYGCQITAISNGIATLKIVDGFPTQSRMIYGGAVSKFDAPITLTLAELLGAQFSWGMSIISIGDLSAGTMKIGNVPITEEDGTIIIYRVNGRTLIQKPNSALVIAEQAENITFEGVTSYEMSRYSLVFNMNWEL